MDLWLYIAFERQGWSWKIKLWSLKRFRNCFDYNCKSFFDHFVMQRPYTQMNNTNLHFLPLPSCTVSTGKEPIWIEVDLGGSMFWLFRPCGNWLQWSALYHSNLEPLCQPCMITWSILPIRYSLFILALNCTFPQAQIGTLRSGNNLDSCECGSLGHPLTHWGALGHSETTLITRAPPHMLEWG